jgi:signal transduction histidine kinase
MEDLLLWSKTQLSSFEAGKEAIDLYDITRQCLELLSLNIDEKQLQLRNQVPVDAVAHSDPNFLQTIIRNLLQNAVKAAPAGTVLSVTAAQHKESWEWRIANEGTPFLQQDFEALVSGGNDAPGLSGMGLRLVAELAARIGATVRFAQEENRTVAVLTLPAGV